MTKKKKNPKKFIEEFGALQIKNSPEYTYPCPRCGQDNMYEEIHKNALSRKAQVYVCSSCGTEEAVIEAFFEENPMPLDKWSLYLTVETLATKKNG